MPINAISNIKLHCCLLILILIIVILLTLPLLLIYVANYRYEETQEEISRIIRLNGQVAKSLNSSSQEVQQLKNFTGISSDEAPNSNFLPSTCAQFANQANLSLVAENFQCPTGSFPCTSCPKICIVQTRQCNGIADCPDRSDESNCHDSNGALAAMYGKISIQSAIQSANSDQSKALDNNSSASLNAVPYVLPNSCSAEDLLSKSCKCNLSETIVIACDNSKLASVPNSISDSVHKILLSNNQISQIDDVKWPKSLVSLTLEYNNITKIGQTAFSKTPNLIRLDLSYNQISEIHSEAFENNEKLFFITIDSNRLTSFDPRMFKKTSLTKLHLVDNFIELDEHVKFGENFPYLEDIALDRNRITIIKKNFFSNMTNLTWLSLTYNQISFIEDGAFESTYKLNELNLSSNRIKYINRLTFAWNLNITRLYLSSNPLESLPVDVFKELPGLKSLNLSHVEFKYISPKTFSLQLDFIYFAKFHYCYYAPHVRNCWPHTDGLSSTKELLAFPILKFAVWIVTFVCISGNIFVFIWRSVSAHEDQTLSLFIRNLSFADLMMGIYLGTIGWKDWYYQQDFGLYAIQWMSSWTCTGIGFLAIFSSELSVFILTIITIERYRSITTISKFDETIQKQRARVYLTLAWLLSFLIAFYPIVEWVLLDSDFYATNGLCLPLHIDQPFTRGWQYSAFIYLGINVLAVIIIMALYLHMYSMIIDGRQVARPVLLKGEKREDIILAIRFFFIVLTDCMCLIPIVVIKIMALSNVNISSSIYGWLVVFIIPINSALNPIVYTLAAPTSLRDAVFRLFARICYKLDLLTGIKSNYSSLPSSNRSSNLDSSSTNTNNNNQIKARFKARGSNSTTCDTYDALSSTNHSKGSIESAFMHHDLQTTSTNSPPMVNNTNNNNTTAFLVQKSPSTSMTTTSIHNIDCEKCRRISTTVDDHQLNKARYCYNHVSYTGDNTIGGDDYDDDEDSAIYSENGPNKKPYDYLSTYENNTLKHKIINSDQYVTDLKQPYYTNGGKQTMVTPNSLDYGTSYIGLHKVCVVDNCSSIDMYNEHLNISNNNPASIQDSGGGKVMLISDPDGLRSSGGLQPPIMHNILDGSHVYLNDYKSNNVYDLRHLQPQSSSRQDESRMSIDSKDSSTCLLKQNNNDIC